MQGRVGDIATYVVYTSHQEQCIVLSAMFALKDMTIIVHGWANGESHISYVNGEQLFCNISSHRFLLLLLIYLSVLARRTSPHSWSSTVPGSSIYSMPLFG